MSGATGVVGDGCLMKDINTEFGSYLSGCGPMVPAQAFWIWIGQGLRVWYAQAF